MPNPEMQPLNTQPQIEPDEVSGVREKIDFDDYRQVLDKLNTFLWRTEELMKTAKPEDGEVLRQRQGRLHKIKEKLIAQYAPTGGPNDEGLSVMIPADWRVLENELKPLLDYIPTLHPDDVHLISDEGLPETSATVTLRSDAPIKSEKAQHEIRYPGPRAVEEAERPATTLRKIEGDTGLLMDYDMLGDRMNDWLERIAAVLSKPEEVPQMYRKTLPELEKLKNDIVKVRETVQEELDLEKYGEAKAHHESHKVFVPEEWYKIEARVNELAEAMKGGFAIRPPEATVPSEQEPRALA